MSVNIKLTPVILPGKMSSNVVILLHGTNTEGFSGMTILGGESNNFTKYGYQFGIELDSSVFFSSKKALSDDQSPAQQDISGYKL